MADFLILQTGDYLLLNTGDKVLLSVQTEVLDTTLPLLESNLFGSLGPVEGLSTELPRIVSSLAGSLGATAGINTTLPLLASILGGINTQASTLPLIVSSLYGVVAVKVGSGLYKQLVGDLDDTYYNKVYDGNTTSVKIPNPLIQTYLVHDEEDNIIHTTGYKFRAIGSGVLRSTFYTMDSIRSRNLANYTLQTTTNKEPMLLSNFSSRRIILRIYTSSINEYFDLSRILVFIKKLWTQRPG